MEIILLKDWTKKWRLAIWHPFGSSANFSLEFFSLVLECRTILVAETHQSDGRCRMANADWFSLDTNKCIKGVNREENTVSCIVISECDALCEKFFFFNKKKIYYFFIISIRVILFFFFNSFFHFIFIRFKRFSKEIYN